MIRIYKEKEICPNEQTHLPQISQKQELYCFWSLSKVNIQQDIQREGGMSNRRYIYIYIWEREREREQAREGKIDIEIGEK